MAVPHGRHAKALRSLVANEVPVTSARCSIPLRACISDHGHEHQFTRAPTSTPDPRISDRGEHGSIIDSGFDNEVEDMGNDHNACTKLA